MGAIAPPVAAPVNHPGDDAIRVLWGLHADLFDAAGLADGEVVRGGIGIGKGEAYGLAGLHGELGDVEEHTLLHGSDLDLRDTGLFVEVRLVLGAWAFEVTEFVCLLEVTDECGDVGVLVVILPMRQECFRAERRAHGILQMIAHRMLQDTTNGLDGAASTDVAGGDDGFHAHE